MVWLSGVLLFQNVNLVTVNFEALNFGIDSAFIPNGYVSICLRNSTHGAQATYKLVLQGNVKRERAWALTQRLSAPAGGEGLWASGVRACSLSNYQADPHSPERTPEEEIRRGRRKEG